jgi:uncharacterized protein YodC (DUF2158 family)
MGELKVTEEFEAGDVVVLKSELLVESYITLMTIDSISGDLASCVWFVNGHVERHNFYTASLAHYKSKESDTKHEGK